MEREIKLFFCVGREWGKSKLRNLELLNLTKKHWQQQESQTFTRTFPPITSE